MSESNSNNSKKRNRESAGMDVTGGDKQPGGGIVLHNLMDGGNNGPSWDDFLREVWQQRVCLLGSMLNIETLVDDDAGRWRNDKIWKDPWREMVTQGKHIVVKILEASQTKLAEAKGRAKNGGGAPKEHEIPLVFQSQCVLDPDTVKNRYGDNLFAAYLDGCSVVLNHADLLSPWLAHLCQDLQHSFTDSSGQKICGGFPHAYANCYLTPPGSQTAPLHADDRDVLIFQLVGQKKWQVYSQVPVPFPFPHEQVGKEGREVPPSVLQGPKAFDQTLQPGDVLYLPRGMVHQAQSTARAPSFHITVALATHDWTLAGNLSRNIQQKLMEKVDFRKSLLPLASSGDRADMIANLQKDMNEAFTSMQKEITAEKLLHDLETRAETHNRTSLPDRIALIDAAMGEGTRQADHPVGMHRMVGPRAAQKVTYSTMIRAATPQEKIFAQELMSLNDKASPGLNVREEIADNIVGMITKVKESAVSSSSFQVSKLRDLYPTHNPLVCDLTLLCLAKRAVELGAFSLADASD